jgi:hypothetical protein
MVASTIKTCSGPYATDESASDERIAKALTLFNFCSPSSFDLSGLPINKRFMDE